MLRSLIPCMVFCAISALILGQKHAGFMLYLLVPVMLVYMAISAWRIRKQPQRLPELPLKMLLCLTTISSIAMLHTHYHKQARLEADKIAKQIQAYQQQYHAYPKDLQAAQAVSTSASRTHYTLNQNQQPSLFYPATFVPFEAYAYDFQTQQWQHQPD